MYLKILQKLRCLVAFQNRPSAPIGRDENFVTFELLQGQFWKESLPLTTKRKLCIHLNFPLPFVSFSGVLLTLKRETLVL